MLYQWLRRTCLTLTLAAMFIVPLWHLGAISVEGAGLAGGGRWSRVADAGVLSTTSPRLTGTLWSFEIFGVEILDPLAGISLLATGRSGAGVLLALLPPLLLVMLLGRFFCGWMCPYVPILAASNATRSLLAKAGIEPPNVRLDRGTPFVVLACVLLLTAIGGAVIAPLLYPPAIIGRQLFRAVFFGGVGSGVLVLVLAFAFDTFACRAGFCRYLCPGGALFRVIGAASPVRVRRHHRLCEDCGACVVACNLDQSPRTDGLDSGCERCGKCVAACPNGALRMTAGRPLARLIRRERPS